MKITFMICARGNSNSVPWKNKISPFEGENIYQRIKHKIEKTGFQNSNIVVNTDNLEIESLAKEAGLKVFKRQKSLGDNKARLVDVNLQYKNDSNDDFDYLVNISPVAPFIKVDNIKKIIKIIRKENICCGGTATKHLNNSHPLLAMRKDPLKNEINYLIKSNQRYPRQVRFESFYANGCLFFRKRSLISGNKVTNDLDSNFEPIYQNEIESLNIDSKLDWEIAKLIASSKDLINYH